MLRIRNKKTINNKLWCEKAFTAAVQGAGLTDCYCVGYILHDRESNDVACFD